MADIKISELERVQSLNNGDLVEVSQEDSYSETGYSSKSAKMTDLGEKVVNGIEYTSELNTSNKKIIGAINEIASYTPVYGNTASGSIATFDTSLALPLQDCTIDINAVQEGSGTPSPDNVRPITGFTSVNVSVRGVNLWDEKWEVGSYDSTASTVVKVVDNTHIRSKNPIRVLPNHTYYMNSADNSVHLIVADTNGNVLYRTITLNNGTFTTPADGVFVYFNMARAYGVTYNNDVSINYPSTDTDYHAYNGTTVTISLGQTVYGGSLDVTRGELTVDRASVTLNGSEEWNNKTGLANIFSYSDPSIKDWGGNLTEVSKTMADTLPTISQTAMVKGTYGICSFSWGHQICVMVENISSAVDLKTYLSSNPLHVVYELATPITYQLTPTQISAIVGTNNVFTDTNGDTSVVYACSLKDYIDSQ